MSGSEGFPSTENEQKEAIFFDDGSLNETALQQRFGIGREEAMQPVAFGSYNGTVAQMLSDERCPVGGMLEGAYQERGIEGVEEKFKSLSQIDPQFKVELSPQTIEREQVKKK